MTSNGSITYKFLFKNIFTATTSITNCPEVKVDDLTRDIFVNFKSKETCNGSGKLKQSSACLKRHLAF